MVRLLSTGFGNHPATRHLLKAPVMNKHAVRLVALGTSLLCIAACGQQKPPLSPPPDLPQSSKQKLPQDLLASNPIVAIGHGVMIGADGQTIVPTAQLIESVQQFTSQGCWTTIRAKTTRTGSPLPQLKQLAGQFPRKWPTRFWRMLC